MCDVPDLLVSLQPSPQPVARPAFGCPLRQGAVHFFGGRAVPLFPEGSRLACLAQVYLSRPPCWPHLSSFFPAFEVSMKPTYRFVRFNAKWPLAVFLTLSERCHWVTLPTNQPEEIGWCYKNQRRFERLRQEHDAHLPVALVTVQYGTAVSFIPVACYQNRKAYQELRAPFFSSAR